ncbi:hypothetical protein B4135_3385 [Caldibacillus debilis]|uniref:Uncharacterized protein n=1 Tax=Caldibacillus debilis TaxID=301148 RepID=A0A150LE92_9BACI|nr:hypothetical protein B4135_3385 [Caldibacillus debilis]
MSGAAGEFSRINLGKTRKETGLRQAVPRRKVRGRRTKWAKGTDKPYGSVEVRISAHISAGQASG